MKIKEQTRKLAVGCSKHCFEVVDGLKRFSKSISPKFWFNSLLKTPKNPPNGQVLSILFS